MSRSAGVDANVLVPVQGMPCLQRVLTTLAATASVQPAVVVGPAASIMKAHGEIAQWLAQTGFRWLPPQPGPAASGLAGLEQVSQPTLLTTGDHALLTPAIVNRFIADAAALKADFVVGLVPYENVRARYPQSRRTVLRFSDGGFCGSNLFAIITPAGADALRLWRRFEADRKKPWKIAHGLGPGLLLRYLLRLASVDDAMQVLSERAGCRIRCAKIEDCHAAIDVDSEADWQLAEKILSEH
ncbi:MAG: NTP transferase domain-containing protein [Gammaproteobacteria bacterium]|nr:NTP transferase domain-containing protein [Gammaproteobacteria bacterium]